MKGTLELYVKVYLNQDVEEDKVEDLIDEIEIKHPNISHFQIGKK